MIAELAGLRISMPIYVSPWGLGTRLLWNWQGEEGRYYNNGGVGNSHRQLKQQNLFNDWQCSNATTDNIPFQNKPN